MQFRIRFVFIFLVNVLFVSAQSTLTTSDILASAKHQFSLQLKKQQVDFLKKTNAKLPLLDELEFRTQTNDFQIKEQQYVLRGRFHTRKQRRAQKDFHQANIELNSIDEQILLHELLKERYVAIMEKVYFEKILHTKKEQKVVLEDRLNVLQKSIQLPKFEITNLIDAENELQEAERMILELENAMDFSQQKIYRLADKKGYLNSFDNLQLIDIEQVMSLVRGFSMQPSATHAMLVKRKLNAALAVREQAVREAANKKIFDYVQTKVGGTNDSGFRQNFSLGMGMNIPVRNKQQFKLNELELDRIAEEVKYEELNLALTERMIQIRMEIENKYRVYVLLQNQMKNSQADYALQQYQKIATASPLVLLKLKASKFKKELEQLKIQQDIYILYIELLDASGKLAELPLKNYLMGNLEAF